MRCQMGSLSHCGYQALWPSRMRGGAIKGRVVLMPAVVCSITHLTLTLACGSLTTSRLLSSCGAFTPFTTTRGGTQEVGPSRVGGAPSQEGAASPEGTGGSLERALVGALEGVGALRWGWAPEGLWIGAWHWRCSPPAWCQMGVRWGVRWGCG